MLKWADYSNLCSSTGQISNSLCPLYPIGLQFESLPHSSLLQPQLFIVSLLVYVNSQILVHFHQLSRDQRSRLKDQRSNIIMVCLGLIISGSSTRSLPHHLFIILINLVSVHERILQYSFLQFIHYFLVFVLVSPHSSASWDTCSCIWPPCRLLFVEWTAKIED